MNSYRRSEQHLLRSELTIPLGSQTFSKSRLQYPVGISPLYASRAKGCSIWDLDGNEFIDLVSSLASVTIGYRNKRVESSIKRQLKRGVSLSLPGILEAEVAELICSLVPSAEMVRFAKNGTDATSAAVRLSRAYTGKDHVAVCGYHGWQDWYIGATSRNKGVPKAVSNLTHSFRYNNLESLEGLLTSGLEFACVVMEPMNSQFPDPGYLEGVRLLTKKYGVLLVFDETITGFRFASGGAQEYFGVTPDLSTFGKGLANGFPLSAVAGKREIMMEMEEIFFSGTFGGELLSLAAAKAVLELHVEKDIPGELGKIGETLSRSVEDIINSLQLKNTLSFSGHPSWRFLNWTGNEAYDTDTIRTYFLQEMFRQNVLILSTHNVSIAHGKRTHSRIINAYENALTNLSRNLLAGTLSEALLVSPIRPIFKVR